MKFVICAALPCLNSSNCFTNQTTAHATAYLFGLLALEQETQEELYDHIVAVLGDKQPVMNQVHNLLSEGLTCSLQDIRRHPPLRLGLSGFL